MAPETELNSVRKKRRHAKLAHVQTTPDPARSVPEKKLRMDREGNASERPGPSEAPSRSADGNHSHDNNAKVKFDQSHSRSWLAWRPDTAGLSQTSCTCGRNTSRSPEEHKSLSPGQGGLNVEPPSALAVVSRRGNPPKASCASMTDANATYGRDDGIMCSTLCRAPPESSVPVKRPSKSIQTSPGRPMKRRRPHPLWFRIFG